MSVKYDTSVEILHWVLETASSKNNEAKITRPIVKARPIVKGPFKLQKTNILMRGNLRNS